LNAWNKSRKDLAEKATKSISEYFASSVKAKFTGTISAIYNKLHPTAAKVKTKK